MGFIGYTKVMNMSENEFISKTVACYYSFKNSHVLVGMVDADQNLIICGENSYTNKSIFAMVKELSSYSSPVWINKHEPLKYSLGEWLGGELDFSQESEVESLNDLYDSLIAEKRLQAPDLALSGQNIERCFKILIKSLQKDLCQQQQDFSFDVGEKREIYSILEGY